MTVLLLNASYEPLRVISMKRAVVLVLQDKAEIIEADEEPVRSATFEMLRPSVIRLVSYVNLPYRAKVPLNRRTLATRDRHTCQYCGNHGNTIDHVIPRSRGGRHEWTNVVLACGPCNFTKSDRLLSELGWALPSQPSVPKTRLVIGMVERNPAWEPHLALT